MSNADEFTARFIKTEVFAEAQQAAACDEALLGAIYAALEAHSLATPFMQADESVVPRQLNETSAPEWSRAAADVYLACGGGSLTAAELFAFIERVAQLRLEPFASVFAAALVQLAERDGWAETVAAISQAPLDTAHTVMVDWTAAEASAPVAIGLLGTALRSELEFREPPSAAHIDCTHDRTFVQDE